MAIGLGGGIVNTKEQLQDMSSEDLVTLLESDYHGRTNKQWATEILTVRLTKAAIEAKVNAFCEG